MQLFSSDLNVDSQQQLLLDLKSRHARGLKLKLTKEGPPLSQSLQELESRNKRQISARARNGAKDKLPATVTLNKPKTRLSHPKP